MTLQEQLDRDKFIVGWSLDPRKVNEFVIVNAHPSDQGYGAKVKVIAISTRQEWVNKTRERGEVAYMPFADDEVTFWRGISE